MSSHPDRARLADRRRCISLCLEHLSRCPAAPLQCHVCAALWAATVVAAAAEHPTRFDEPHPEWIATLLALDVDGADDETRSAVAEARTIAARGLRFLQRYAVVLRELDDIPDAHAGDLDALADDLLLVDPPPYDPDDGEGGGDAG